MLTATPTDITDSPASLRGAAVASCLGAAAAFRLQYGLPVVERSLSAWSYAEGGGDEFGPPSIEPVDVGRVLVVGAGAVAAAMAFWLRAFGGIVGPWTILDADCVELHNTNRGLIFLPSQTSWDGGTPRLKAEVVTSALEGAVPVRGWYDEAAITNKQYDLILCLANDRGVRHQVAARNAAIVLQATTGENWLSQLHRHVLGKDDCTGCRNGAVLTPQFGCSGASISHGNSAKSDAALPFLSAASGLMLATALQQLQLGTLAALPRNDWRWDFGSTYRMSSSGLRSCRSDCANLHVPKVRERINRGTRWAHLDPLKPVP